MTAVFGREGTSMRHVLCLVSALTASILLSAAPQPDANAARRPAGSIVDRFLSSDATTLDPAEGFRFVVLESTGSGLIKNRVFLPALEAERRVEGVRVPMAMESTADVLIAGRSTFAMTYDYQSVNGHVIGASTAAN